MFFINEDVKIVLKNVINEDLFGRTFQDAILRKF